MAIQSITYYSSIHGLILQPLIELKSPNSSITRIEIKTEGEKELILSFFLYDVFSEDEAKSITYDIARELVDKISFKYGCTICEPKCKCIMKEGYVCSYDVIFAHDEISSVISIGEAGRKNLQLYLETSYGSVEDRDFLHLYCFMMKEGDPVSRFLLLYSFLSLIKGNQKEIDKLIWKTDSNVPIGKETLFTRLRNEIMHPKGRKKKLTEVKEEMGNNVGWLQDIVKRYLESKFSLVEI